MVTKEVLQGRLEYYREQLINIEAAHQVFGAISNTPYNLNVFTKERLKLIKSIKETQKELEDL